MSWDLYLNFLAAMFAIANPLGILPIWSELTGDKDTKIRRKIAFLITSTSLFILLLFLYAGEPILIFFSIDLSVFKIGGGVLILFAGISMVQGNATKIDNREEKGETSLEIAKQRFRKILVPLAIPALAGPGSITTVILYGTKIEGPTDFLALGLIVLSVMITLFLMFSFAAPVEGRVDNMIFNVITRLFGIMVTAIAIQFMVEGLGDVFPSWLEGNSSLEDGTVKKENSATGQ